MRLRSDLLAGTALACVIAALGASGCAGKTAPASTSPGPSRGGDFRAISVRGVTGQAAPLSAVLERRPTLVSFWAPWCEPCLKEQPELERLSRAAQACGGAVVGVAVGEAPDGIAAFARQKGLTFPQYTDENFTLADAIGQRRIPATMVFDDAQRVVFTGEALDAKAIGALRVLLARPCAMP